MKSWHEYSQSKTLDPQDIEKKVAQLRAENNTIATLNGSFDLLHAGHMYMLFEAAKCANILIVAINSDVSIKAYKSLKRPFIPLQFRMQMLTALECVDFVTWFEEPDPCAILERIKPDVHVNGVEYGMDCIEAKVVRDNGGRIHLVDRIANLSTTGIVRKIQEDSSVSCV